MTRPPKNHLAIYGSFDAASRSPEAMRHYRNADYLSADAALTAAVRLTIVSRARYEVANNGYADGIISTLAEDAIGTGPRLQLFISDTAPTEYDEILEAPLQRREQRFRGWMKAIKLTEKLKIARKAKARDGEVFLRLGYNPKIKNHVKVDLTSFEAEQVGSATFSEYTDFHPNGTPKEFDGIIFDEYGNPEKYRFWRIHPGATGVASLRGESDLVTADDVIHYSHITRPGQHRGISEIAPTLNIFNDLRRFTNAVLTAAETAAEISFLLHTDTPADETTGSEEGQGSPIKFMDVIELVRNAGLALPEGWKANQMKAEHPIDTYGDFVDAKLSEAARPVSMPFNVAKGNSSKYNYASGRLDHQTYHKKIYGERNKIEDEILDRLLTIFEQYDRIAYPKDYAYEDEILHGWMWDGFEHVDPNKEATAQEKFLNNLTTTRAEECARDGKDYLTVLRQRARENKQIKRLGLEEKTTTSNPPEPAEPEDDDNQEDSKND